jgi:putative endonuclease
LASAPNGILYVGVTSDPHTRMAQHDQGLIEGFTKKYGVKQLVYYEFFETMPEAITREKRLKEWQRAWKVRLIKGANPEWKNLFDPVTGEISPLPSDVVRMQR